MSPWQKQIRNTDVDHPVRITDHLARLIDASPEGPVARQFLPDPREKLRRPAEREDSVAEEPCRVAESLIHAYPDRAVLMCTQECAAYCRFCFRKRLVGQPAQTADADFAAAFDYLRQHPEIHDVILSGGDPLVLPDERLDFILARLGEIPSIRVVRVHTRILTARPQRITPGSAELLARHNVMYMNCHINHPDELTGEARVAAGRLRRAGVALGSQTVLLKGVNDNLETMRALCLALYHVGIQPYYLFHCEYVAGCAHFRPSLAAGREIWRGLQGRISGMAVPRYVLDTPSLRKIPLYPNYATARPDGTWHLRNFRDHETIYREPDILE